MKIGHTTQTERLGQLKVYKRTVASRYRCILDSELDELPEGKFQVSPKVDGELWFISVSDGKVALMAHNGREITDDLPLLAELQKLLAGRADDVVIAGELFALSEKGRPRVGDVAHALGPKGDVKRLGFQAFDLLVNEGEAPPAEYTERYACLEKLLDGGKRVKAIKTMDVPKSDIPGLYEKLVASGKAEGLIARAEDGRIFKIKPAFHVDCIALGFTQRREAEDQVRSILLGLERPDGSVQVIGSCGNLGTDAQRQDLHKQLSAIVVESQFRKVASSGALYQLCAPKVVVEIVASDVQSENSKSEFIKQWALALNETDGWVPMAPVNGASLLHPRMERIRDDKTASGTDVRIAQLNERCLTQGLDDKVEKVELAASEIIRREVYTKKSKDKLAVRKLLVWKTNKAEVDPTYPAFVVHFTDYSPSRASPIKREVRLAPEAAIAETIADGMIASNIKKGWSRV